ncbi:MAG: Crp/Fnr family transcriptional regulator [bacterium]|nr:Crp/Fnr family transcriptional regulator [bacterium]
MQTAIAYKLIDSIPPEYLNAAERMQYPVGDYIIRPNEPVKWFYILLSGSAKLVYESPKGEALILDIYHAGDFFGEMEMVDLQTVDRAIIAMTPCEAYRFSRRQFFDLWDGASAFSRLLLAVHSDRLLRAGDDKIYAERTVLREKVFRIIQNHINARGCFLYTKHILAEMAGVSIRSLNRTLRELEDDALIVQSGGTIRLHI